MSVTEEMYELLKRVQNDRKSATIQETVRLILGEYLIQKQYVESQSIKLRYEIKS
jgi:hypothetical protein